MRKLTIFTLLFITSVAVGAPTDLNEVRACLEDIRSNQDPLRSQEIINTCYDRALPWATSASLQGRSLYVQVLQEYLNSGSDRASIQSLAEKLADYYRRHLDAEINSHAIRNWSDLDVRTVYDGITAVEFYTSKLFETDVALKKYKYIFEDLEKRNIATELQAHYLYSALLSNGQWNEARDILKRWPTLSPLQLPLVVNKLPFPPKLGYYVVSPDLKTMTLKAFDSEHGPRIILSGFCHFAIDLIRVLSNEAEIAQLMKQYGIAINPNDFGEFDFQKMDALRKEFPSFEFHPVTSSGVWFSKGVHTLSSPTVLFRNPNLS